MPVNTELRKCKTCGEEKELTKENYRPRSAPKRGFDLSCKSCQYERKKVWGRTPRGKELTKATDKRKYERSRERRIAYTVAWQRQNRDKHRKSTKRYYEENKVKWSAYSGNRRSMTKTKSFTKEEFDTLVETFNGCCAYCLETHAQLVPDHFIPLSKGGSNEIENIVPACASCNGSKHNKTPLEIASGVRGRRLFPITR